MPNVRSSEPCEADVRKTSSLEKRSRRLLPFVKNSLLTHIASFSLKGFSLVIWYEGSSQISLRYHWFNLRCHFPVITFLRLGKAGWYMCKKTVILYVQIFFLYRGLISCWQCNLLTTGWPLYFWLHSKFWMFSSKVVREFFLYHKTERFSFNEPSLRLGVTWVGLWFTYDFVY